MRGRGGFIYMDTMYVVALISYYIVRDTSAAIR